MSWVPAAAGQSLARAAVLKAAPNADPRAAVAVELPVLLAKKLGDLRLYASIEPTQLPFRDLGLAIGCVPQEADCESRVAKELDVEVLLSTQLVMGPGALRIQVVLHDLRAGTAPRAAERPITDPTDAVELSVVFDDLIFDLYGVRPQAHELTQTGTGAPSRVFLLTPWPWAIGGVATLAAGLIAGGLSRSAASSYAGLPTHTPAEVDAALEQRGVAENRALVANVLFGVTAALAVTGVAMGIFPSEDEP
jgi:hypothetical protein